jgi:CHAT domain-containing protein
MNADMVVLSACETGLGKEVKGEGLVGMTRAFLYAGSQSVVASLWKTSDLATEELMVRFYSHLRDDSPGRAEALRRARLDLIEGGQFSHPYFWSPFILVGKS